MNKVSLVILSAFYFLEISASDGASFESLLPKDKLFIETQHNALMQFVSNPELTNGVVASERSNNRSEESTNTMGSFNFVLFNVDEDPSLLISDNCLYTSGTQPEQSQFVPCFKELKKHWGFFCPENGKLVIAEAKRVFQKIEDEVKKTVDEEANKLEGLFDRDKFDRLLAIQKVFCKDYDLKKEENNIHEVLTNVKFIVVLKDVDKDKLEGLPLLSKEMTDTAKKFPSTIIRHGWHAEQRMLFMAQKELLMCSVKPAPQRVVMCLYTDNTPCHSSLENINQCRCRQTLDALSKKHTLGEAFALNEEHAWYQVPFTLTVSFSYKYDMDNANYVTVDKFDYWLFYFNNKLNLWTNCLLSKKEIKKPAAAAAVVGDPAVQAALPAVRLPKSVFIPVAEIDGMHKLLTDSRSNCGCSDSLTQWRHIQDILKDMPPTKVNSNQAECCVMA